MELTRAHLSAQVDGGGHGGGEAEGQGRLVEVFALQRRQTRHLHINRRTEREGGGRQVNATLLLLEAGSGGVTGSGRRDMKASLVSFLSNVAVVLYVPRSLPPPLSNPSIQSPNLIPLS